MIIQPMNRDKSTIPEGNEAHHESVGKTSKNYSSSKDQPRHSAHQQALQALGLSNLKSRGHSSEEAKGLICDLDSTMMADERLADVAEEFADSSGGGAGANAPPAHVRVKFSPLLRILTLLNYNQAIVFLNDTEKAAQIAGLLTSAGIPAVATSGKESQSVRRQALLGLKTLQYRVCVATDLWARGVDLASVNLVINLDLPPDKETYLHRAGRCARFGNHGCAMSVLFRASAERQHMEYFRRQLGLGKVLQWPADRDVVEKVLDRGQGTGASTSRASASASCSVSAKKKTQLAPSSSSAVANLAEVQQVKDEKEPAQAAADNVKKVNARAALKGRPVDGEGANADAVMKRHSISLLPGGKRSVSSSLSKNLVLASSAGERIRVQGDRIGTSTSTKKLEEGSSTKHQEHQRRCKSANEHNREQKHNYTASPSLFVPLQQERHVDVGQLTRSPGMSQQEIAMESTPPGVNSRSPRSAGPSTLMSNESKSTSAQISDTSTGRARKLDVIRAQFARMCQRDHQDNNGPSSSCNSSLKTRGALGGGLATNLQPASSTGNSLTTSLQHQRRGIILPPSDVRLLAPATSTSVAGGGTEREGRASISMRTTTKRNPESSPTSGPSKAPSKSTSGSRIIPHSDASLGGAVAHVEESSVIKQGRLSTGSRKHVGGGPPQQHSTEQLADLIMQNRELINESRKMLDQRGLEMEVGTPCPVNQGEAARSTRTVEDPSSGQIIDQSTEQENDIIEKDHQGQEKVEGDNNRGDAPSSASAASGTTRTVEIGSTTYKVGETLGFDAMMAERPEWLSRAELVKFSASSTGNNEVVTFPEEISDAGTTSGSERDDEYDFAEEETADLVLKPSSWTSHAHREDEPQQGEVRNGAATGATPEVALPFLRSCSLTGVSCSSFPTSGPAEDHRVKSTGHSNCNAEKQVFQQISVEEQMLAKITHFWQKYTQQMFVDESEWRCDGNDGRVYQLSDFIAEYGGSVQDPPAEWWSAEVVLDDEIDFEDDDAAKSLDAKAKNDSCQGPGDMEQKRASGQHREIDYRVDEDGYAYTLSEFIAEYGGSVQNPPKQWLQADLWDGKLVDHEEGGIGSANAEEVAREEEESVLDLGTVSRLIRSKKADQKKNASPQLTSSSPGAPAARVAASAASNTIKSSRTRVNKETVQHDREDDHEELDAVLVDHGHQQNQSCKNPPTPEDQNKNTNSRYLKRKTRYDPYAGNAFALMCLGTHPLDQANEDAEHRVDIADGRAYRLWDFLIQYGGGISDPPHEWLTSPTEEEWLALSDAEREELLQIGQEKRGGLGFVLEDADIVDDEEGADDGGHQKKTSSRGNITNKRKQALRDLYGKSTVAKGPRVFAAVDGMPTGQENLRAERNLEEEDRERYRRLEEQGPNFPFGAMSSYFRRDYVTPRTEMEGAHAAPALISASVAALGGEIVTAEKKQSAAASSSNNSATLLLGAENQNIEPQGIQLPPPVPFDPVLLMDASTNLIQAILDFQKALMPAYLHQKNNGSSL
ncbi:unnamed protein product [Amoebophrya sp. A25]|nr:unnamed protein product [Amoebophrya sp. A25]|eukprot:GSA25T00000917001.1